MTWKEIDKAIKWKPVNYPDVTSSAEISELIDIKIFILIHGLWAQKFAFSRSNNKNQELDVFLYKPRPFPPGNIYSSRGSVWGFGILPNIKDQNTFKKLIKAYIDKDFETMKKMLYVKKSKIFKFIFSYGESKAK